MDTNTKKSRSKLIHWLSRIGTTFGLAGASWLYLRWADLQGGVFYAGLLCALTAHEFSGSTNPDLKSFRRWALTIISFFTPYFFYRVLQAHESPIMTIRLFELFMVLFLLLSLAAIAYPSVLKMICNSILFQAPARRSAPPADDLRFGVNSVLSPSDHYHPLLSQYGWVFF